MILKFNLSLFYVLHLNISLNYEKNFTYTVYTLHVQSRDISIRLLVTSPFKLVYFQSFCKNYCRKTIEASIINKVLNKSILIYAINIFIVASWCLLFSHGSHLNTKTN